MKTNNDDFILAGFRQGQEKAVKQIFERFHKELVAFATRITLNRYEAQDIVVEAFLKILPRAQNFASIENVRAFLYVVVRHACYEWVEKQEATEKKQQAFVYLQQVDINPEPEAVMDNEEMIARTLQLVYEHIQQLPPQEKKVFVMKVIQQQSVDEIAAVMNISKKTVYNLSSSAINRLRNLVGKSGFPLFLLLCTQFSHFFSNQQEF
ncbi:MAG: RNA polymerase sigma factor [Pseudobacter sp.]|uniref:RNA polymerase sigma factor n=1 Tax=Pseudobacter sp. TaxID=2045420 RepID=UPI003F7F8324